MSVKFLDPDECLKQNSQLDLQARNYRAQLAAQGKTFCAPTLGGDLLVNNAALRLHVAELKTALGIKLDSGSDDAPVEPPPSDPRMTKPQTLTEKVLAAKSKESAEAKKTMSLD